MPKRTNDFQSLIALVESQLADVGAQLTESKMTLDGRTGELREVDIHIEQSVGNHQVRIAVECIDHGRPATVEWIDRMIGKYRDLPIDKLIAVSQSGFTKSAREKAQAARIDTMTLQQAAVADWARVLNRDKRLRLSKLELADVKVGLLIRPEAAAALDEGWLGERVIAKSDGSHSRKLSEEVARCLSDKHMQAQIQRELDKFKPTLMEPGQTSAVSVQLYYEDGMTIADAVGIVHEVKGLQLILTFEYSPTRIPLQLSSYGDALVASASFDVEQSRVTYAIVESPGREPTFGVSVRSKEGNSASLTAMVGAGGHVDFVAPKDATSGPDQQKTP